MFFAGHAHDGRDTGRQRSGAHLCRCIEIQRAVFHVDEQPVEAGGFADGGDVGGARLPQAETVIFEDSSHFFLMEEPERFMQVMNGWLERHTPAAG